jgi:hypothetical protein
MMIGLEKKNSQQIHTEDQLSEIIGITCFNKKQSHWRCRLPLPWPVVSSSPNVTCRRSLLLLCSSAADPSCNSTRPNSSNNTLQSMIGNLTSSKCRLFYLIVLLELLCFLELMSSGGDVLLYYCICMAALPSTIPPPPNQYRWLGKAQKTSCVSLSGEIRLIGTFSAIYTKTIQYAMYTVYTGSAVFSYKAALLVSIAYRATTRH